MAKVSIDPNLQNSGSSSPQSCPDKTSNVISDVYALPKKGQILIGNGNEWVSIENASSEAIQLFVDSFSKLIIEDDQIIQMIEDRVKVSSKYPILGDGTTDKPLFIDMTSLPDLI